MSTSEPSANTYDPAPCDCDESRHGAVWRECDCGSKAIDATLGIAAESARPASLPPPIPGLVCVGGSREGERLTVPDGAEGLVVPAPLPHDVRDDMLSGRTGQVDVARSQPRDVYLRRTLVFGDACTDVLVCGDLTAREVARRLGIRPRTRA